MTLTNTDLTTIFELRLLPDYHQKTWKQVSEEVGISPSRLRTARKTPEYALAAYGYLLNNGYCTNVEMLKVVGANPGSLDISYFPTVAGKVRGRAAWYSYTGTDGARWIENDGGRADWLAAGNVSTATDDEKAKMAEQLDWNDAAITRLWARGGAGDCVPRAIAIALNRDYAHVWQALEDKQQRTYQKSVDTGTSRYVYEYYLALDSWVSINITQPRDVDTIATLLNRETCVLIVKGEREKNRKGGHAVAIVNGNIEDTWDCSDREVETIWIHASRATHVRTTLTRDAATPYGVTVTVGDETYEALYEIALDDACDMAAALGFDIEAEDFVETALEAMLDIALTLLLKQRRITVNG